MVISISVNVEEDAYKVLEHTRKDVGEFLASLDYHEDIFEYVVGGEQGDAEIIIDTGDPYSQLRQANKTLIQDWKDADRSVRDLEAVYRSINYNFQKAHSESTVTHNDFRDHFGFMPSSENYNEFSDKFFEVKNAYENGEEELRARSELMKEYGLPDPVSMRIPGDIVFMLEEMELEEPSFQKATSFLGE